MMPYPVSALPALSEVSTYRVSGHLAEPPVLHYPVSGHPGLSQVIAYPVSHHPGLPQVPPYRVSLHPAAGKMMPYRPKPPPTPRPQPLKVERLVPKPLFPDPSALGTAPPPPSAIDRRTLEFSRSPLNAANVSKRYS